MNRRKFLNIMGGCCCSIILPNCSTNEITQRKQLILYPESFINKQSEIFYKKFLQRSKISENKKDIIMMNDIGKRLIDNVNEYFIKIKKPNPTLDFKWEYNLIEDKQVNAFCPTIGFDWEYILIDNKKVRNAWCMPGGKIAIYTGILDVTKNTNGLAAVMGHEIAHAVAKHSAERMSRTMAVEVGFGVADVFTGGVAGQTREVIGSYTGLDILDIAMLKSHNRNQESEADYMGLAFCSMSGYDLNESVRLWKRMNEKKGKKEIPQFLSTHPSSKTRIIQLRKWIPEVKKKFPLAKIS